MRDVSTIRDSLHVALKQRFLNEKLKGTGPDPQYIHVHPIIVIANDNVMLENESANVVIRASQVYNYIQSQLDALTYAQVNEVVSVFRENQLEAKKFPHIEYSETFHSFLAHMFMALGYMGQLNGVLESYVDFGKKNQVGIGLSYADRTYEIPISVYEE